MQKVDVLIVGGSLGGLMAANLLLRAGFSVLVLEKSSVTLESRGAGIVTHSALLQVLAQCGVTVDESLGVRVQGRVVLNAQGNTVARNPYSQLLTSWGRLYSLLYAAFESNHYVLDASVDQIEVGVHGVTAHCADGRCFGASILIGADGIRSVIRSLYAPEAKPLYAGYVAWRGICDEAVLSNLTLHSLFDHFAFGLPEAEQILGYPVAGPGNDTRIGKRCYNFVWYRPASTDVLRQLMQDADGNYYPGGIAPNKVSWRAVSQARLAAQALLAPQFAEVLEKTAQPFIQPIFDLTSNALAFDRVGLIGDAAFVARPHVGMGVTKAAQDAAALASAVQALGATPQALARYQSERLTPSRLIVERGRRLGAYMESQSLSASVKTENSFIRTAQSVMQETAIDLDLTCTV
jgi:2-polyprenyl-6-methoxyphenol hydroxylase-like FAD-dependent oxidoreductase